MQVRMSYHYRNFKPGDVVDLPADEALQLIASFRATDASAVPSLTVDGVFRGTVQTGPPPAAPGSWQPGDWMTARDGSGPWTLDLSRSWTPAASTSAVLQARQRRITQANPTEVVIPPAFAPLTTLGSRPIVVDPASRGQQILGFGAAITEATAYLIMRKLSRRQRWDLLHDLFGPDGFSMIRIGVGGTDFNTGPWWSCDETIDGKLLTAAVAGDTSIQVNRPFTQGTELRVDAASTGGQSELVTVTGPPVGSAEPWAVPVSALQFAHPINRLVTSTDRALTGFNIMRSQALIIPLLQEILAVNPAVRIHASVWQIPSWMRTSVDFTNNSTIFPDAQPQLATYLVRFVQAYQTAGVPIYSLSFQNEPAAPGASFINYTAAQYAAFISGQLGPAFDAANLTTRILAHDHHWAYSQFAADVLADNAARPYIGAVGWHGYGGEAVEQFRKIGRQYPSVPQHFTEMRTLLTDDWPTSVKIMAGDCAVGALRNGAESVTLWNLALDETGNPSWNTPGRRGVITIPSDGSGSIVYNAEYHIFRQLAAVVQPGAQRTRSTSYATGRNGTDVESVAFVNPDESIGLLVFNPTTGPLDVTVADGRTRQGFPVTLAAGEVSVFSWGQLPLRRAADPTYPTPAASTKTPSVLTNGSFQTVPSSFKRFSGNYTVPAGNDRCLIVAVETGAGSNGISAPLTVDIAGVPLQFVDYADNKALTANQRMLSFFYLLNPPVGVVTLNVTLWKEAPANVRMFALADVHQVDPFGIGAAFASASTVTGSITVPTSPTDLVVAGVAARTNSAVTTDAAAVAVGGQNAAGNSRLAVTTQPGTGSPVSPAFTMTSADAMSVAGFVVHGAP